MKYTVVLERKADGGFVHFGAGSSGVRITVEQLKELL
jgi:hypothetical protein